MKQALRVTAAHALAWAVSKLFPRNYDPFVGVDYGHTEAGTCFQVVQIRDGKVELFESFFFDSSHVPG